MWKRSGIVGLSVVAVVALLPWTVGWTKYGYGFLDSHVAFYMLDDGGTLYSDGYVEGRFQSIELGMSKNTVQQILGDPIVRPWFQGAHGDPSQWWYAFQSEPGMNAHRRCVQFGPDQRVSGLVSEPNID